ncbi:MAG: hypothetical protein Q8K30_02590 [Candidatus Gracilibacteria bacterium]|nr:hypothetical protein [Candidatus Gracilibacteria bacterium]
MKYNNKYINVIRDRFQTIGMIQICGKKRDKISKYLASQAAQTQ